MRIIILLMCVFISSCKIPYKSDVGFISDGQANYPSAVFSINGKNCNGVCGVIIRKNKPFDVKLLAMPFNYKVRVLSSDNYAYDFWYDVMANSEFHVTLPATNLDVVNLMVRIYRADALPDVSTFAEARIRFFDEAHVVRSQPYISNGLLILGEESLYVNCDGRTFDKLTTVKADKCKQAYSESWMGRVATYGINE